MHHPSEHLLFGLEENVPDLRADHDHKEKGYEEYDLDRRLEFLPECNTCSSKDDRDDIRDPRRASTELKYTCFHLNYLNNTVFLVFHYIPLEQKRKGTSSILVGYLP